MEGIKIINLVIIQTQVLQSQGEQYSILFQYSVLVRMDGYQA